MHVYIAIYGYIYQYMWHLGAREVYKTPLQRIHTQEASMHYTKLIQL